MSDMLQHAQAPEEAGLQRPPLRQEEGLAGSIKDSPLQMSN